MDRIAKKIREFRKMKDMTLKEMSEQTDLSVGFLSQVERGSSSLAITSLKKIADALNVEMADFFQKEIEVKYTHKLEEQKPFQITGSDSTYTKLSGHFIERELEALTVVIPPLQVDQFTFSHPGEEFYYVLKGAVIFVIDNEEHYLKEGESIHFPSTTEHMWKNPLEQETVLLSVLTPIIF
ncbi:XRE family transcriptional regulator [Psychrobacillus sp. FSL K6-2836]|uniref:helix-turn-helix domain-containing protein n=1 Tax=Psychrobacillus sp. FSL K6-2836 TaxID=2921548 RepID=UPI0030F92A5F